jgi:hypothetical protein
VKGRNTLAAAVVLSALVAWIYFYEYRGEESREAAELAEKRFVKFDEELVKKVTIIGREGRIDLSNAEGQWRIGYPVDTPADQGKVAALFSTISRLEVRQRLGVLSSDLSRFGLAAPALSVTLSQSSGADPIKFDVGGKAPIGQMFYARMDSSGEVMTISGSAGRLIETQADSLRYRKIVGIDSWKISGLNLSGKDAAIDLVKSEGMWMFTHPIEFPAETAKVSTLLHELFELSATGFEKTGVELASIGLDFPETILSVTHQDGRLRIEFSREDESGTVRARRDDMPEIFKLSAELMQKVRFQVEDLRDPRIAPVDRWKISGIHSNLDGVKSSVVKDSQANWRRDSIDGPALERTVIDALLKAVDGARAVTYIDEPAASPANASNGRTLSMEVESEGLPVIVLQVKREDDSRVIISSSAASSRYVMESSAVEKLFLAVEALSLRSPAVSSVVSDEEEPS